MNDARSAVQAEAVAQRLEHVRERIARACARSGRDARSVSVLAVTKGFGPEAIEAALATGLTDIGENYLQEAQRKFAAAAWAPHSVRHFIGRVQRNKARRIAESFDVVQTLDDEGAAARLDEGARAAGKTIDALIQLNISDDERSGIDPEAVLAFAQSLRPHSALRVRGVMAVGPDDATRTSAAFARAARAFERLRAEHGADVMSLGMSGDLEVAVAAGSTMVRLGTALFGARPAKVVR